MSEHLEFERKSPRKIVSIETLRRYRQFHTIIKHDYVSEFLTKSKMVEDDFDVFGTKGKLISTLYLCELELRRRRVVFKRRHTSTHFTVF